MAPLTPLLSRCRTECFAGTTKPIRIRGGMRPETRARTTPETVQLANLFSCAHLDPLCPAPLPLSLSLSRAAALNEHEHCLPQGMRSCLSGGLVRVTSHISVCLLYAVRMYSGGRTMSYSVELLVYFTAVACSLLERHASWPIYLLPAAGSSCRWCYCCCGACVCCSGCNQQALRCFCSQLALSALRPRGLPDVITLSDSLYRNLREYFPWIQSATLRWRFVENSEASG